MCLVSPLGMLWKCCGSVMEVSLKCPWSASSKQSTARATYFPLLTPPLSTVGWSKTARLNNLGGGEMKFPFLWKLCHHRPTLWICSLTRGLHDTWKWVFRDITNTQTDIVTLWLTWPRGQSQWKSIFLLFNFSTFVILYFSISQLFYYSTVLLFYCSTFLLFNISTFLHFYIYTYYKFLLYYISTFLLFYFSTVPHFCFSTFVLFNISSFLHFYYSTFLHFYISTVYFSTFLPFYFSTFLYFYIFTFLLFYFSTFL